MTPSEVLRTAFAAFRARDWDELAGLALPADLVEFQRRELTVLCAWFAHLDYQRETGIQADGFSVDGEASPEALAAYSSREVGIYPGAPPLGEVANWPPALFYARSLAIGLAAQSPSAQSEPGPARPLPAIIGELHESDVVAHVLFRRAGHNHPGEVEVASLQRVDGLWRLALSQRMRTLASPFLALPRDEELPELLRQVGRHE